MKSLRRPAPFVWASMPRLGEQPSTIPGDVPGPSEDVSLGELKAIQREQHLCGHCSHAPVCKVVAAIEPHLLVIISQCMAFDPDGRDQGARS